MQAVPRPEEIEPTEDERLRFAATLTDRMIGSVRFGLVAAMLLCGGLVMVLPVEFPEAPASRTFGPLAVVVLAMLVGLATTYTPLLRRYPVGLLMVTSNIAAAAIGVGASGTGGMASPVCFLVFLIWILGSQVAPLPVRAFCLFALAQLTSMLGATLLFSAVPARFPGTFGVFAVGAAGMCVLGTVLRDRSQLRSFAFQLRLDQANRTLAENQAQVALLNSRLEQRVQEQVAALVSSARDVDALSVQLKERVQERSRELGLALRRLSQTRSREAVLRAGDVVGGRAVIERPLGAGGMGAVYLARDLLTERQVAVKLLHPGLDSDPATLQRFVTEAAGAAAVSHPGIVRTLHVDVTPDGRIFHIMDHVEGVPLAEVARLPAADAARIGAAIADALAAAHAAGVIHRDVKPGNVLVTASAPGVCLLDFGLSKVRTAGDETQAPGLTQQGMVMGTPRYMAPEQVRDSATVTGAADVYSLGLLLYELVCGDSPFPEATSPSDYMVAHVSGAPRRLPEPPGALADLIADCLSKDPTARPTAAGLAVRLSAIADAGEAPAAEQIGRRIAEHRAQQPPPAADVERAPTVSAKRG